MRRLGSDFELKRERDHEMYSVYKYYLSLPQFFSLKELLDLVIGTPTSRFWVSAERAAIVVQAMDSGNSTDGMTQTKQEMYQEIYSRYKKLRNLHPNASTLDLVSQVVIQPAPKLYMTQGSTMVTIYRIKKEWKKAQK